MNQDTEAVVIFAIGAAILIALVGIFGLKDRPKKRDRTSTPTIDDSIDWPDDKARAIAERAIHGHKDEVVLNQAQQITIAEECAALRAACDERFAKARIADGMTAAGRARLGRG